MPDLALRSDRPTNRPYHRPGFTLVELLVVIAIIGILVALLLPAVQAAREAARRTQCTAQLKNMVLAMVNHESTNGELPSSGWAGNWSGDPDRNSGAEQPGSWFFSILPYIEEQAIYDMGAGQTGVERRDALVDRDATPLAIANCPSRRDGGPYRGQTISVISGNGEGGTLPYSIAASAARIDYAASVGDMEGYDNRCKTISPAGYGTITPNGFPPRTTDYNGVTFCGAAVELRQITDGTSKTLAIGEKFVPVEFYVPTSPLWEADDWSMYTGFQDDIVRSTFYDPNAGATHTPQPDTADVVAILDDVMSINDSGARELFGSAHAGGAMMAMCDGSVSLVNFDVDPEVFRQMGDRSDGGYDK